MNANTSETYKKKKRIKIQFFWHKVISKLMKNSFEINNCHFKNLYLTCNFLIETVLLGW